jgi:hypothetical protein
MNNPVTKKTLEVEQVSDDTVLIEGKHYRLMTDEETHEFVWGAPAPAQDVKQTVFETLARPLIKFLNDNFNPHTQIIITPTSAEIVVGETGFTTNEYVRD